MRQEAYRVAFEEANWELKDIVGQFDALSSREEQVERVLDVLKPFIGFGVSIPGSELRVGEQQPRGMRQEAYRVAFEEASVELKEFVLKFEQLRFRKEQIERLVDVLKPLVGQLGPLAVVEQNSAQPETIPAPEVVAEAEAQPQAAAPEPVAAVDEDPFQRRGEVPVTVVAAAKDLRDYSRLFSSSLHRR